MTPDAPGSAFRIAVTGAGAMGGLFGARLALAGFETALIDVDPQRLAAINASGLNLQDDAGDHHLSVTAGRAEDFVDPVDLLIVFTKSMHTDNAIRAARHILSSHSWVLTLQNGIGNERSIAAVVGQDRIAYGVTTWPADLTAPGRVRSHGAGIIRLWSMSGALTPQLQKIADMLNAAKMNCILDEHVKSAIWEKVIFNAAMNGISAITRNTVGAIADSSDGAPLIAKVVAEGLAVTAACGITVDAASIRAAIKHALAEHRAHKPSMLQDIEAQRPTEVEAILGAIGREGRSAHVATPVIDTLASLVRIIDQARRAKALAEQP